MRILLIDNYDSFTFNLLHYLRYFTKDVCVIRNDRFREYMADECDKILLSPGPGLPLDAGVCESIIKIYGNKKPILGVCLGHQAIATSYGGVLKNLPEVLHGIEKETIILKKDDYLFTNIKSPFICGRYHSWVVDRFSLPSCLEIIAEDNDGEIMGIRHKEYDIRGVQFHPESVMSSQGIHLVKNWINHKVV
jgi:anthranilate synthase component 2